MTGKHDDFKTGTVTTSDGVRLTYMEAGAGLPLVLVHGWTQSAEQFKHQIKGLSAHYRVIAIDQRGHGSSEKPEHGYRISRLARDLHDALEALGLSDVALLGHSMGCSVIWSYIDLFGSGRLARLIFVDEPPFLTSNSAWSQEELESAGSIFTPQSVVDTVNALAGPSGEEATRGFVAAMLTKGVDPDLKEWVVQQNLRMPRRHAAELVYNHAHQDWRDVIRRITLPTLVFGGRVSLCPWKAQEWIHRQIKGSRLAIFEEAEGGSHLLFLENPDLFNRTVLEFLG